jgi:hypothetical protein
VLESGGIVPVRIAHSGPRWRANWAYPLEERCAQAIEEGRAQGEQPFDEALDLLPGHRLHVEPRPLRVREKRRIA